MRIMLTSASRQTPSAPADDVVLRAESVSFRYGGEPVLSDVSMAVQSGEFAALVGPNGSGKSTLLRVCLGLLEPDAGQVELFGRSPRDLRDRWRVGAGRLAKQGWWHRARAVDRDAVDHALESVALTHARRRRIDELSGGEQQRVLIAKALAAEPELLVLDEPIAGVDVESQALFRDSLVHLVREHGAAVLLVSHELRAVADDLDHLVVLKRQVVFDGTPDEFAATGVSLGVHREDLPLWLEELDA